VAAGLVFRMHELGGLEVPLDAMHALLLDLKSAGHGAGHHHAHASLQVQQSFWFRC
jgi:hypothetical protein